MTVSLTMWQRLALLGLLSSAQGDLRVVNKALKLIDILELDKEESELCKVIPQQDGTVVWSREDTPESFDFDITDNYLIFLKDQIRNSKNWPANREVIDLCTKLEIELPE